MYACLGTAFLACGITMNIALKQYFPHFYKTNSCSLWLATISLSVPLFLRAVINLVYKESKSFQKFFLDQYIISNNTFLVFSTYIPIVTSTFSLVFGYLRRRQEKMTGSDPKGPSKPSTHGGSGEPQANPFDDMVSYVSSGMASDL